MTRLVNIALDNHENGPVIIDAETITAITEIYEDQIRSMNGGSATTLSFSASDEQDFLWINKNEWRLDTAHILKTLRDNDVDLFPIPYFWSNEKIGMHFVNPATFNYIMTSAPSRRDGTTEDTVSVFIGFDGTFIESHAVPVAVIDEFMDRVQTAISGVVRIDPEEAPARFNSPGFVVYDPKKIVRINQNGYGVDFKFENGGHVDFRIPTDGLVQMYLDKKINNHPVRKHLDTKKQFELAEKSYVFEKKMRGRLAREFARRAAKDTRDLIKVERTDGPYYARFNGVSRIGRNGNRIFVDYKESAMEGCGMNSDMHIYFRREEHAKQELERLQKVLSERKPQI